MSSVIRNAHYMSNVVEPPNMKCSFLDAEQEVSDGSSDEEEEEYERPFLDCVPDPSEELVDQLCKEEGADKEAIQTSHDQTIDLLSAILAELVASKPDDPLDFILNDLLLFPFALPEHHAAPASSSGYGTVGPTPRASISLSALPSACGKAFDVSPRGGQYTTPRGGASSTCRECASVPGTRFFKMPLISSFSVKTPSCCVYEIQCPFQKSAGETLLVISRFLMSNESVIVIVGDDEEAVRREIAAGTRQCTANGGVVSDSLVQGPLADVNSGRLQPPTSESKATILSSRLSSSNSHSRSASRSNSLACSQRPADGQECPCFGAGKSRLARWLAFPGRFIHKREIIAIDGRNTRSLIDVLERAAGDGVGDPLDKSSRNVGLGMTVQDASTYDLNGTFGGLGLAGDGGHHPAGSVSPQHRVLELGSGRREQSFLAHSQRRPRTSVDPSTAGLSAACLFSPSFRPRRRSTKTAQSALSSHVAGNALDQTVNQTWRVREKAVSKIRPTLTIIDSVEPPHFILHQLHQHNYFRTERAVRCPSCGYLSTNVAVHKTIVFTRRDVFFRFPLPCPIYVMSRRSMVKENAAISEADAALADAWSRRRRSVGWQLSHVLPAGFDVGDTGERKWVGGSETPRKQSVLSSNALVPAPSIATAAFLTGDATIGGLQGFPPLGSSNMTRSTQMYIAPSQHQLTASQADGTCSSGNKSLLSSSGRWGKDAAATTGTASTLRPLAFSGSGYGIGSFPFHHSQNQANTNHTRFAKEDPFVGTHSWCEAVLAELTSYYEIVQTTPVGCRSPMSLACSETFRSSRISRSKGELYLSRFLVSRAWLPPFDASEFPLLVKYLATSPSVDQYVFKLLLKLRDDAPIVWSSVFPPLMNSNDSGDQPMMGKASNTATPDRKDLMLTPSIHIPLDHTSEIPSCTLDPSMRAKSMVRLAVANLLCIVVKAQQCLSLRRVSVSASDLLGLYVALLRQDAFAGCQPLLFSAKPNRHNSGEDDRGGGLVSASSVCGAYHHFGSRQLFSPQSSIARRPSGASAARMTTQRSQHLRLGQTDGFSVVAVTSPPLSPSDQRMISIGGATTTPMMGAAYQGGGGGGGAGRPSAFAIPDLLRSASNLGSVAAAAKGELAGPSLAFLDLQDLIIDSVQDSDRKHEAKDDCATSGPPSLSCYSSFRKRGYTRQAEVVPIAGNLLDVRGADLDESVLRSLTGGLPNPRSLSRHQSSSHLHLSASFGYPAGMGAPSGFEFNDGVPLPGGRSDKKAKGSTSFGPMLLSSDASCVGDGDEDAVSAAAVNSPVASPRSLGSCIGGGGSEILNCFFVRLVSEGCSAVLVVERNRVYAQASFTDTASTAAVPISLSSPQSASLGAGAASSSVARSNESKATGHFWTILTHVSRSVLHAHLLSQNSLQHELRWFAVPGLAGSEGLLDSDVTEDDQPTDDTFARRAAEEKGQACAAENDVLVLLLSDGTTLLIAINSIPRFAVVRIGRVSGCRGFDQQQQQQTSSQARECVGAPLHTTNRSVSIASVVASSRGDRAASLATTLRAASGGIPIGVRCVDLPPAHSTTNVATATTNHHHLRTVTFGAAEATSADTRGGTASSAEPLLRGESAPQLRSLMDCSAGGPHFSSLSSASAAAAVRVASPPPPLSPNPPISIDVSDDDYDAHTAVLASTATIQRRGSLQQDALAGTVFLSSTVGGSDGSTGEETVVCLDVVGISQVPQQQLQQPQRSVVSFSSSSTTVRSDPMARLSVWAETLQQRKEQGRTRQRSQLFTSEEEVHVRVGPAEDGVADKKRGEGVEDRSDTDEATAYTGTSFGQSHYERQKSSVFTFGSSANFASSIKQHSSYVDTISGHALARFSSPAPFVPNSSSSVAGGQGGGSSSVAASSPHSPSPTVSAAPAVVRIDNFLMPIASDVLKNRDGPLMTAMSPRYLATVVKETFVVSVVIHSFGAWMRTHELHHLHVGGDGAEEEIERKHEIPPKQVDCDSAAYQGDTGKNNDAAIAKQLDFLGGSDELEHQPVLRRTTAPRFRAKPLPSSSKDCPANTCNAAPVARHFQADDDITYISILEDMFLLVGLVTGNVQVFCLDDEDGDNARGGERRDSDSDSLSSENDDGGEGANVDTYGGPIRKRRAGEALHTFEFHEERVTVIRPLPGPHSSGAVGDGSPQSPSSPMPTARQHQSTGPLITPRSVAVGRRRQNVERQHCFITGAKDNTLSIFSIDDCTQLKSARIHQAPIVDICATNYVTNRVVVSCDESGVVIVSAVNPYDLQSVFVTAWSSFVPFVRSLHLSYDGSWLCCVPRASGADNGDGVTSGSSSRVATGENVTSSSNGPLALPISEWTRLGVAQFHTKPITCIYISPCEGFLFTGGADGVIFVWDLGSQARHILSFRKHALGSSIVSITASSDGTRVASSDSKKFVQLWRRQCGTVIRTVDRLDGAAFCQFLAPHDFLAVRTANDLRLYDPNDKLILRSRALGGVELKGSIDFYIANPADKDCFSSIITWRKSCMTSKPSQETDKKTRPGLLGGFASHDSDDTSDSEEATNKVKYEVQKSCRLRAADSDGFSTSTHEFEDAQRSTSDSENGEEEDDNVKRSSSSSSSSSDDGHSLPNNRLQRTESFRTRPNDNVAAMNDPLESSLLDQLSEELRDLCFLGVISDNGGSVEIFRLGEIPIGTHREPSEHRLEEGQLQNSTTLIEKDGRAAAFARRPENTKHEDSITYFTFLKPLPCSSSSSSASCWVPSSTPLATESPFSLSGKKGTSTSPSPSGDCFSSMNVAADTFVCVSASGASLPLHPPHSSLLSQSRLRASFIDPFRTKQIKDLKEDEGTDGRDHNASPETTSSAADKENSNCVVDANNGTFSERDFFAATRARMSTSSHATDASLEATKGGEREEGGYDHSRLSIQSIEGGRRLSEFHVSGAAPPGVFHSQQSAEDSPSQHHRGSFSIALTAAPEASIENSPSRGFALPPHSSSGAYLSLDVVVDAFGGASEAHPHRRESSPPLSVGFFSNTAVRVNNTCKSGDSREKGRHNHHTHADENARSTLFLAATAADDLNVIIWNWVQKVPLACLPHESYVNGLAFWCPPLTMLMPFSSHSSPLALHDHHRSNSHEEGTTKGEKKTNAPDDDDDCGLGFHNGGFAVEENLSHSSQRDAACEQQFDGPNGNANAHKPKQQNYDANTRNSRGEEGGARKSDCEKEAAEAESLLLLWEKDATYRYFLGDAQPFESSDLDLRVRGPSTPSVEAFRRGTRINKIGIGGGEGQDFEDCFGGVGHSSEEKESDSDSGVSPRAGAVTARGAQCDDEHRRGAYSIAAENKGEKGGKNEHEAMATEAKRLPPPLCFLYTIQNIAGADRPTVRVFEVREALWSHRERQARASAMAAALNPSTSKESCPLSGGAHESASIITAPSVGANAFSVVPSTSAELNKLTFNIRLAFSTTRRQRSDASSDRFSPQSIAVRSSDGLLCTGSSELVFWRWMCPKPLLTIDHLLRHMREEDGTDDDDGDNSNTNRVGSRRRMLGGRTQKGGFSSTKSPSPSPFPTPSRAHQATAPGNDYRAFGGQYHHTNDDGRGASSRSQMLPLSPLSDSTFSTPSRNDNRRPPSIGLLHGRSSSPLAEDAAIRRTEAFTFNEMVRQAERQDSSSPEKDYHCESDEGATSGRGGCDGQLHSASTQAFAPPPNENENEIVVNLNTQSNTTDKSRSSRHEEGHYTPRARSSDADEEDEAEADRHDEDGVEDPMNATASPLAALLMMQEAASDHTLCNREEESKGSTDGEEGTSVPAHAKPATLDSSSSSSTSSSLSSHHAPLKRNGGFPPRQVIPFRGQLEDDAAGEVDPSMSSSSSSSSHHAPLTRNGGFPRQAIPFRGSEGEEASVVATAEPSVCEIKATLDSSSSSSTTSSSSSHHAPLKRNGGFPPRQVIPFCGQLEDLDEGMTAGSGGNAERELDDDHDGSRHFSSSSSSSSHHAPLTRNGGFPRQAIPFSKAFSSRSSSSTSSSHHAPLRRHGVASEGGDQRGRASSSSSGSSTPRVMLQRNGGFGLKQQMQRKVWSSSSDDDSDFPSSSSSSANNLASAFVSDEVIAERRRAVQEEERLLSILPMELRPLRRIAKRM